MNTTFMDECFKARMNHLNGRIPIEDFKRRFKEQYERNGMVMIQPITNPLQDAVMIADYEAGFIFKTQHDLDAVLHLLRRWGFNVTAWKEHDERRAYTAYIVQLPDEYIAHHLGRDKAGMIRTRLRSISNVNRTKSHC